MNVRSILPTDLRQTSDWEPVALLVVCVVAAGFLVLAMAGGWSASAIDERIDALSKRLDVSADTYAEAEPASDQPQPSWPDRRGGSALSQLLPESDPGRAAAQRIKGRYVFAPKPPDRFRAVRGVLGDVVLLQDGSAAGIGDNIDGAVVREIGADWVRYDYQGDELIVYMAGAQRTSGNSRRRAGVRGTRPGGHASPNRRNAEKRGQSGDQRSQRERRTGRLPGNISPEALERLRQRAGDSMEIIVDEEP
ncbi:MAG: hypothetical protein AAGJ38_00875 [Planctomycetota bacterium]